MWSGIIIADWTKTSIMLNKLKSSLWKFDSYHDFMTRWPWKCFFVVTIMSFFPCWWLITGYLTWGPGNMTCVTCEAGTSYPSGAPEFISVFSGVHVSESSVYE